MYICNQTVKNHATIDRSKGQEQVSDDWRQGADQAEESGKPDEDGTLSAAVGSTGRKDSGRIHHQDRSGLSAAGTVGRA